MDYARVGNFKVTDVTTQDPEAMRALLVLLSNVFITAAIHNWGYGRFEYIGCSCLFDSVMEGAMAPEYVVEFEHPNATNDLVANFVKVL
jgi:hypothetical protein